MITTRAGLVAATAARVAASTAGPFRHGPNIVCGGGGVGAWLWARAHPDAPAEVWGVCCWGALDEPQGCTCWRPEFDVEQTRPALPVTAGQITARRSRCSDCAYRPDSPERGDEWASEELDDVAASARPFWCHEQMRRPVRWAHPDGRTVPGDPADWQPATVGLAAFRADGRPALLCAGWVAQAVRAARLAARDLDERMEVA